MPNCNSCCETHSIGYTGLNIYSTPVKEEIALPDTDRFFFPPKHVDGGAK